MRQKVEVILGARTMYFPWHLRARLVEALRGQDRKLTLIDNGVDLTHPCLVGEAASTSTSLILSAFLGKIKPLRCLLM